MQELMRRYELITDEIEKEKKLEMDRLISSLASAFLEEKESPAISQQEKPIADNPKKHYENMLALLCLRIEVTCELIRNGNNIHYDQLEEDVEVVVENTRNIECAWDVSDEIIDHVRDVLTVICQGNLEVLLPLLDERYQNKLRGVDEVSPEQFLLFTSISKAYERLGKRELSVAVLEWLCQISRERNGRILHQEVISKVFSLISDRAPETVVRIARLNFKYFDQVKNNYAGDF